MNFRSTLFLIFCLISQCIFAQSELSSFQKTRYRLGLILPTLSLETPLAKDLSLKTGVTTWFTKEGHAEPYVLIIPTVFIEPRLYVNGVKRRKNGFSTDYFSGGYLSIISSMTFIKEKTFGLSGLIYGGQGTIGKNKGGFYDVGIGFGMIHTNTAINLNPSFPIPIARLDIGFRIR